MTPDIYRVTDGSLAFRLKYAYATWTPEKSPLTAKFGLIHTPWLDWEEALWDYRMQGSMAMERFRSVAGAGYLSSADFGAGIDGKFGYDKVNFQIGAYNGEFYSKPEGDSYKDVEARVSVRVLESDDYSRVGGLALTGYAGIGSPTGGGRRNRYIGMVSYKSKLLHPRRRVRPGAGPAGQPRDRSPAPRPPGSSAAGGLGCVELLRRAQRARTKVGIIGRYDLQKPDINLPDNKQQRLIAGVSYQLTPQVRVLADLDNFWNSPGSTPTR